MYLLRSPRIQPEPLTFRRRTAPPTKKRPRIPIWRSLGLRASIAALQTSLAIRFAREAQRGFDQPARDDRRSCLEGRDRFSGRLRSASLRKHMTTKLHRYFARAPRAKV